MQQDAAIVRAEGAWTVLALCDGVSGLKDGGLAARVGSVAACDTACRLLREGEPLAEVVRSAIMTAHRAVYVAAAAPPHVSSRPPGPLPADRTRESPAIKVEIVGSTEPPGATIVIAAIRASADGTDAAIGWAGDSRAYLVGAGPALLTQDHSWANAMLATGHVTREEAFAQPLAHALTRCIGPLDDVDAELVPDVVTSRLAPGSALVLCSDGVWAYMAEPEAMSAVALQARREPSDIARALVRSSATSRRPRQRERRGLPRSRLNRCGASRRSRP